MPRTLPWLTGSSSNKVGDATSSQRRREVKPERDSDAETPKAFKLSTPRPDKRDFLRSSPSPPPTAVQRYPSEEYLIEGFDNDDIYMMVEDEFYAMAQTFTQHLHYEEYLKRKKEAKMHNLAAIKELDRPTDGITPKSEETKRRDAAAALSARQRTGLEKIEGKRPQLDSDREEDDTDEDDGLVGTSLGYLMTSPRKARSLMGMQSIKSSTRAAAGFVQASGAKRQKTSIDAHAQSSSELEGEDHAADATGMEDDDLDVQITQTSPRRTAKKPSIGSDLSSPILGTSSSAPQHADNDDRGKQPAHGIHRTQTPGRTRRKVFFDDDFDELPEPSDASLKSHTANNTKDPKESVLHSKKSRLNEVPTFLF